MRRNAFHHNLPMETATPKLEILYRDRWLVAINKPAGLLVHRSRIDTRATEFAVQKLRDQIGQSVFLLHRLDRPTSGVLLFGLDKESARKMGDLFLRHQIEKTYRAIVRGHLPPEGIWDRPLGEKLDPISDAQADTSKPAQSACTAFASHRQWEVPFSAGKYPTSRYCEARFMPRTGRRHQIRRHCNHFAHPIVGDTTHGDRRHNRLFREQLGINRLLLVASSVQFVHPFTGDEVQIESQPGEEYEMAIQKLEQHSIEPG